MRRGHAIEDHAMCGLLLLQACMSTEKLKDGESDDLVWHAGKSVDTHTHKGGECDQALSQSTCMWFVAIAGVLSFSAGRRLVGLQLHGLPLVPQQG